MKGLLAALLAAFTLTGLHGCAHALHQPIETLRIGYQKWGTFSILKASGELAKAFGPKVITVEWIEFPAGPPLLEALNAAALTSDIRVIRLRSLPRQRISRSYTLRHLLPAPKARPSW